MLRHMLAPRLLELPGPSRRTPPGRAFPLSHAPTAQERRTRSRGRRPDQRLAWKLAKGLAVCLGEAAAADKTKLQGDILDRLRPRRRVAKQLPRCVDPLFEDVISGRDAVHVDESLMQARLADASRRAEVGHSDPTTRVVPECRLRRLDNSHGVMALHWCAKAGGLDRHQPVRKRGDRVDLECRGYQESAILQAPVRRGARELPDQGPQSLRLPDGRLDDAMAIRQPVIGSAAQAGAGPLESASSHTEDHRTPGTVASTCSFPPTTRRFPHRGFSPAE